MKRNFGPLPMRVGVPLKLADGCWARRQRGEDHGMPYRWILTRAGRHALLARYDGCVTWQVYRLPPSGRYVAARFADDLGSDFGNFTEALAAARRYLLGHGR